MAKRDKINKGKDGEDQPGLQEQATLNRIFSFPQDIKHSIAYKLPTSIQIIETLQVLLYLHLDYLSKKCLQFDFCASVPNSQHPFAHLYQVYSPSLELKRLFFSFPSVPAYFGASEKDKYGKLGFQSVQLQFDLIFKQLLHHFMLAQRFDLVLQLLSPFKPELLFQITNQFVRYEIIGQGVWSYKSIKQIKDYEHRDLGISPVIKWFISQKNIIPCPTNRCAQVYGENRYSPLTENLLGCRVTSCLMMVPGLPPSDDFVPVDGDVGACFSWSSTPCALRGCPLTARFGSANSSPLCSRQRGMPLGR